MDIIAEWLALIFMPIIEGIVNISFESGIIIFGLLGLKKKKEELSFWKKLLISLIGGIIILILISCIVVLLLKF